MECHVIKHQDPAKTVAIMSVILVSFMRIIIVYVQL